MTKFVRRDDELDELRPSATVLFSAFERRSHPIASSLLSAHAHAPARGGPASDALFAAWRGKGFSAPS
eukprot:2002660-Pleurochrysis_carterae.AAC.1